MYGQTDGRTLAQLELLSGPKNGKQKHFETNIFIHIFHNALFKSSCASHPSVNLKNLILLPFQVVNFSEARDSEGTLRVEISAFERCYMRLEDSIRNDRIYIWNQH